MDITDKNRSEGNQALQKIGERDGEIAMTEETLNLSAQFLKQTELTSKLAPALKFSHIRESDRMRRFQRSISYILKVFTVTFSP